jgi:branched-chain amino acid transport system permease protein
MRRLDLPWLAVLVLPPAAVLAFAPNFIVHVATLVGLYALMGVGYQLVFGQLGALNLAQGALFGVGAYTVALVAPVLGIGSFPLAVLLAALVATLAAWPTLRLQSHYFALATLALAALANLVAVNAESLTGGSNGVTGFVSGLPRGRLLLVVVWLCLIAAVVAQSQLFSGPWGENARLLREAPLAAASLGIDGGRWRLIAFAAGGALAGGAGASSAALTGVVSPEATGFPIMVLCLTFVVLGGSRHAMGAVVGAAIAVCLPELFRGLQHAWLLAYAVATLLVVLFAPEGVAGLIDRLRGLKPATVASGGVPERLPAARGPQALSVENVVKRFGGVDALSDASLKLARGEIVGLIGANGSGKTTLLNVVSGLERADAGMIFLDRTAIERLPAHAIARFGIARTFQSQTSVTLPRAIATGASLLLLDEPAAGLGEADRVALEAILRRLRDAGRGVLIVDHDIELLTRVCDRLVCLDRGRVIADGPPAAVRADPRVRASFLGQEAA